MDSHCQRKLYRGVRWRVMIVVSRVVVYVLILIRLSQSTHCVSYGRVNARSIALCLGQTRCKLDVTKYARENPQFVKSIFLSS